MNHRTNPIFRRMKLHYTDPAKPNRLMEDFWGGVMALALLVLYCALMGAF